MLGFFSKLTGQASMPDQKVSDKRKKIYKDFLSMTGMKLKEVIKATASGDELTRKMAALALGKINDSKGIEHLVKALGDPSMDVQENAMYSLIKMGISSVQPLIEELNQIKHSNHDLQANAARVLGWIGDLRAVDPLIKAVRHDNEWIRWNATFALGKIGDKKAVEPIKKARDKEIYPWLKEHMLNTLLELDKK